MYTVHLASARVFVFNIVCFARTKICPGIMGSHNMTVIDIIFVFSQKLSNKVVEFIRKHNDWIKFNLLRKCIVRCLEKKNVRYFAYLFKPFRFPYSSERSSVASPRNLASTSATLWCWNAKHRTPSPPSGN